MHINFVLLCMQVLGPSSDEAVRCSCGEVVAESGKWNLSIVATIGEL